MLGVLDIMGVEVQNRELVEVRENVEAREIEDEDETRKQQTLRHVDEHVLCRHVVRHLVMCAQGWKCSRKSLVWGCSVHTLSLSSPSRSLLSHLSFSSLSLSLSLPLSPPLPLPLPLPPPPPSPPFTLSSPLPLSLSTLSLSPSPCPSPSLSPVLSVSLPTCSTVPCTGDADGDARLWHDTLFILIAPGLFRAVPLRYVSLMSAIDPRPAGRQSASMK